MLLLFAFLEASKQPNLKKLDSLQDTLVTILLPAFNEADNIEATILSALGTSYQNKEVFDDKWIETFYDEKALFLHTMNNIILTKGLLKDTNCKFYFTSISNLETLGTDIPHQKGHGENLRNTPELADAFKEFNLEQYRYVLEGPEWLESFHLSSLLVRQ